MMLQNCNVVELTKVHYFDTNECGRNLQIATIYRDGPWNAKSRDKKARNTVIKKNIFGHRWVLKINETSRQDDPKRSRTRLIVYVVVFACISIAVGFGVFLTLETNFFRTRNRSASVPNIVENPHVHGSNIIYRDKLNLSLPDHNLTLTDKTNTSLLDPTDESVKNSTTIPAGPCAKCRKTEEVCMNSVNDTQPRCVRIVDGKDPTGCGGLCRINKEYCKLLDPHDGLYQCRPLRKALNCSKNNYSCGNMCISSKMRCDGIMHCSDGSDEHNCECDLTTHFQCGNSTGCLENFKKCDGKVDCWDNSDENCATHSCVNGEIPCWNGGCIKTEHFCDGTYHCPDKSDEPPGCEVRN